MSGIEGKVWRLGDNIDTDLIIPSQYCVLPSIKDASCHTFEPIFPSFAKEVREGDIIVAGKNFGCGSSREQAPRVLKEVGIRAIVAKSFARIFFRNAINIGLAVIEHPTLYDQVEQGSDLRISIDKGEITNLVTGKKYSFLPFPYFIMRIIENGGLAKSILALKERSHES